MTDIVGNAVKIAGVLILEESGAFVWYKIRNLDDSRDLDIGYVDEAVGSRREIQLELPSLREWLEGAGR